MTQRRPLNHPKHLEAERLCERAKSEVGDSRRLSLLQAAMCETQAARSVSHELPKWRERVWISAVEKARLAGCPAIAARIASCYLTTIELPGHRQREWLERVSREGVHPIEPVGTLTVAAIERMLVRNQIPAIAPAEGRVDHGSNASAKQVQAVGSA